MERDIAVEFIKMSIFNHVLSLCCGGGGDDGGVLGSSKFLSVINQLLYLHG